MKKKVTALLLTLAMLVACIPGMTVTAFARVRVTPTIQRSIPDSMPDFHFGMIKRPDKEKVKIYQVKFFANVPDGETVEDMPENTRVAAGEYTVPDKEPTRDGHYDFIGWRINNRGRLIKANAVININENTKLYAQWETIPTYTIVYNKGNIYATGEMDPETDAEYDRVFTLDDNKYQLIGHTFAGWATSPYGRVVYANCDEIEIKKGSLHNDKLTLYAKWVMKTTTVTLNAVKGNPKTQTIKIAYGGKPETKFHNVKRKGYTLTGFFTKSGRMLIDENGNLVPNYPIYTDSKGNWCYLGKTLTLYAHWKVGSPDDNSLR